jgi:hypothetical protein
MHTALRLEFTLRPNTRSRPTEGTRVIIVDLHSCVSGVFEDYNGQMIPTRSHQGFRGMEV